MDTDDSHHFMRTFVDGACQVELKDYAGKFNEFLSAKVTVFRHTKGLERDLWCLFN